MLCLGIGKEGLESAHELHHEECLVGTANANEIKEAVGLVSRELIADMVCQEVRFHDQRLILLWVEILIIWKIHLIEFIHFVLSHLVESLVHYSIENILVRASLELAKQTFS